MLIELPLLIGIASAAGSVVSLLRPLLSSYLEKKKQRLIIVTIKTKDGDTRTFELNGEAGREAIEKLLESIPEVINGDKATNPK